MTQKIKLSTLLRHGGLKRDPEANVRSKWEDKRYRQGRCIRCGNMRGHLECVFCGHQVIGDFPETRECPNDGKIMEFVRSPYAKVCVPCADKRREKRQKKEGWSPWIEGKTGRPPLTSGRTRPVGRARNFEQLMEQEI